MLAIYSVLGSSSFFFPFFFASHLFYFIYLTFKINIYIYIYVSVYLVVIIFSIDIFKTVYKVSVLYIFKNIFLFFL